jgi:hypothetical protein
MRGAILMVVAACGRFGFAPASQDAIAIEDGGSPDSAVLEDAGWLASACPAEGTYAAPQLDSTFGATGQAFAAVTGIKGGGDVVLTPAGQYVINGALNADTVVARFADNGTLDTSFGNSGLVTANWSAGGYSATGGVALVDAIRVAACVRSKGRYPSGCVREIEGAAWPRWTRGDELSELSEWPRA